MAGSEATLGKTLGYGDWQPPDHSVIQQPYSQIYMISVTTIIMSLKFQLIQHPICHLALYCSQLLRYYATTVTAAITLLWSLLKQPLIRPNDLYFIAPLMSWRPLYYGTYYVTKAPILQQLLRLHDLYLQLLRHYDLYCRNNYYVTKTSILPQLLSSWSISTAITSIRPL